jgi:hypothetical protein
MLQSDSASDGGDVVRPFILTLLHEIDPEADLVECARDGLGPGYRVRIRTRAGDSEPTLLLTSTLDRARGGDPLALHTLGAALRRMMLGVGSSAPTRRPDGGADRDVNRGSPA